MNVSVKKRITVILKTPNPLFEKWLTEWKEDAKKKGSKMERTFSYALTNLRKCTIPLASGQECKIIKGFGDKLCKMLDEKLADHKKGKQNCAQIITECKNGALKNSNKRQSCSTEYIPKFRSGGYAILLALYSSLPDLLTKEEIIDLGKNFSNHSFVKPDPGSYYTAWSSMRSLLEKGLVIKQGKPARYMLTENGLTIAKKLADEGIHTNDKILQKSSNLEGSPTSSLSTVLQSVISPTKIDKVIRENNRDLSTPMTSSEIPHTVISTSENDKVIDLLDECNEDFYQNALSNEIGDCSNKLRISNHEIELPSIETLTRILPQSSLPCSLSSSDNLNSGSYSSYSSQNSNIEQNKNAKTVQKFMSADSLSTKKHLNKKSSSQKGLKKCSSSSSVQHTQSSVQEDCYIFEPNSFDIILYVDTQETSGSNTDIQDDPLLSKLQNNSVLYEVKHLNVGDYVWICRHRHSKKELVLPYIIERKRLDDFASSIKDGRYREQKFRLKKSGIQNVCYLIENFGKHLGLPLSTLHQAAANTAIQDGFNVKFTANIGHTAKYLSTFSRLLIRNYKDKTIVSCPKENLSEVNITDDLISLMGFNEFNKASSKNKPLRVSELFIKMLLQIKGMSVEKACSVVENYPSPRLLKEAYDRNTSAQGEKLLAKITFGKYNKTIGPVLSKIVYDLFTKENF